MGLIFPQFFHFWILVVGSDGSVEGHFFVGSNFALGHFDGGGHGLGIGLYDGVHNAIDNDLVYLGHKARHRHIVEPVVRISSGRAVSVLCREHDALLGVAQFGVLTAQFLHYPFFDGDGDETYLGIDKRHLFARITVFDDNGTGKEVGVHAFHHVEIHAIAHHPYPELEGGDVCLGDTDVIHFQKDIGLKRPYDKGCRS